MGVLFGDASANFAATIGTVVILTRLAWAGQLLAGLHVFKAQAAGKEQGPPLASRSGKQERRAARQAARQQVAIEGAEQLMRIPLPKSVVEGAHFYHEFELLATVSVILLLNFLLAATPLVRLQAANYKWPLWLAACCPLLVTGVMAKMELLTGGISLRDRGLLAGLASLLTLAAAAAIQFAPAGSLDFQWEAAAEELGWTLTTGLRKLIFSTEVPAIAVSPGLLKAAAALLAGATAGMLAPGTARLARSLTLGLNPPPAVQRLVRPPAWQAGLMRLAVALPLAGALLWVRPMAQELFGWSDGAVRLLRAGWLVLLTLVQLLALRPFVQGYLNGGLIAWWTHKEAVTGADTTARIGEFVRMKVELLNMLLCKVGAELLAPAAVWGGCACVLVFALCVQSRPPPGWTRLSWPWYLGLKAPSEGPWIPGALLTTAAGFLAWWTSLCWFCLTALVLCMHRCGLLAA